TRQSRKTPWQLLQLLFTLLAASLTAFGSLSFAALASSIDAAFMSLHQASQSLGSLFPSFFSGVLRSATSAIAPEREAARAIAAPSFSSFALVAGATFNLPRLMK